MTTALNDVQLTGVECAEVQVGLQRLKASLANATRLGSALELETARAEQLRAQLKQLKDRYDPDDVPPGGDVIRADEVYAVRVAIRLRYGQLRKHQVEEQKRNIKPNPDAERQLKVCLELGRRLGVQLDAIETTQAPEDPELGDEPDDEA